MHVLVPAKNVQILQPALIASHNTTYQELHVKVEIKYKPKPNFNSLQFSLYLMYWSDKFLMHNLHRWILSRWDLMQSLCFAL